jgi:hypothetical protein
MALIPPDADPLSLLRAARPPGQDLLILEPKWLFWFQTGTLRMNYTGPLRMLSWLFRAPSVSSHSTRPRVVTKCQAEKALIGDRDFTSQVSHLWSLEPSGSRNAEMARRLLLRDFTFHEIWMQGISLLLRVSGHEKSRNTRCLFFRDFAFHEIRIRTSGRRKAEMTQRLFLFGISRFVKSGCKGIPAPWISAPWSLRISRFEKPKCLSLLGMLPKCRNALAFVRSTLTIIPVIDGSRRIVISLFRDSGF